MKVITYEPTCPHCVKRPLTRVNEYTSTTCGNSACQQAEYEACIERAALKRLRRRGK